MYLWNSFAVFLAIVAVARAGIIAPAPVAYAPAPVAYAAATPVAKVITPVAKTLVADDYDPHPQYSFAYDIQDGLTGDSKNQHETRDGDVVHGSYSLLEADGTRRIVEYTADPVNGFNAVVHREPAAVAVKTVAPVVAKVSAPIAYAAPVAHASLAYAAPAAKVITPAFGYHH